MLENPIIDRLLEEVHKLIRLYVAYFRLEFVEKLIHLFTALLLTVVMVLLGAGALFYLLFAVVYLLAPLLGSFGWALLTVSGGCVLLIGLIWWFRKPLIVHPLARFLSRHILNEHNTKKDAL